MSEPNKRHNRKIWRSCPVCGGRVVIGYKSGFWWVLCENNITHIPQRLFPSAQEAIEKWNVKANKHTNADRIRNMTDRELADWIVEMKITGCPGDLIFTMWCDDMSCKDCWIEWMKEEATNELG